MNIQIIRVDISQVEQVVPLFDRYRQFYDQPSDLNRAKEFLHDRLTNNESIVFLAVAETALGFTQLYPSFSSYKKAGYLKDPAFWHYPCFITLGGVK